MSGVVRSWRTSMPVEQAVAAVERALQEQRFLVLWQLDVNAKLQEKGEHLQAPYRILEVCNAPTARQALETNPEIGYFLPCKVVVYGEGGQTVVGLVRPQVLLGLLGDERVGPLAEEVERRLVAALQLAV